MRHLAKPLICATLFAALTACGSGSSIGTPPLASTGFAAQSSEIASQVTFNLLQASTFLLQDQEGELTEQNVKLRINAQGKPVIELDGDKFVLNAQGGGVYSALQNDTEVLWLRIAQTDPNVVEMIYLSFETEDSFNASYLPFGFDTAPGAVAAQIGSAIFKGDASVSLRQVTNGQLASGFSGGIARITADFDSNQVAGTLRLNDTQNRLLTLPKVTLGLETSAINGNGFTGDMSVTNGSLGANRTLDDGTYDGRFYGAEASAVAGTLTGTIVTDDPDSPILLQGAFIAGN